jgi:hypothetical protein
MRWTTRREGGFGHCGDSGGAPPASGAGKRVRRKGWAGGRRSPRAQFGPQVRHRAEPMSTRWCPRMRPCADPRQFPLPPPNGPQIESGRWPEGRRPRRVRPALLRVDLAWQLRQIDCARARPSARGPRADLRRPQRPPWRSSTFAPAVPGRGRGRAAARRRTTARALVRRGRAGFESCGDALGSGDRPAECVHLPWRGAGPRFDQAMARAVEAIARRRCA